MIDSLVDTLYTRICPFYNEVYDCFRLDRPPGDEFNIILADLHCPLSDPPCCFLALEDALQWLIRDDLNSVHQEVVFQLPGRHEDCVEQLLNLWYLV
jgi:hypothetical protein